jgi:hypothetical protein
MQNYKVFLRPNHAIMRVHLFNSYPCSVKSHQSQQATMFIIPSNRNIQSFFFPDETTDFVLFHKNTHGFTRTYRHSSTQCYELSTLGHCTSNLNGPFGYLQAYFIIMMGTSISKLICILLISKSFFK